MKKRSIFIITGLSGSGKSTAIAAFEDSGCYCVDNMPIELLPKFLELPIKSDPDLKGFAFVMDMRAGNFLNRYADVVAEVRDMGFKSETIFLEADEDILVSRYSQTRRHHPVAQSPSLVSSIRSEKKNMLSIRGVADQIIDTSDMNVHQLKEKIRRLVQNQDNAGNDIDIKINVLSFGFKYGIPREADLVMDMRFLKNPYFVPGLKAQDGTCRDVQAYIFSTPEATTFLLKAADLLDFLVPLYQQEGKAYLTIAIGCTGGRHRSVAIAGELFEHLNRSGKKAGIIHRDIERDVSYP